MKEIIKKAAYWGFIGAPVFILSFVVTNGIINGVTSGIQKCKENNK